MLKTISIDFDGVIHQYSKGWADGTCYDQPVAGALNAITTFQEKGYAVFILSTRKAADILTWLQKHAPGLKAAIIPPDLPFWNRIDVVGITNRKLAAICYIDDRGLKFQGDWDTTLNKATNFETYQEWIK